MIELFPPDRAIQTKINLKGSKSISNRLLILKEVLGLDINISNLSFSEDTLLLKSALDEIRTSASSTIHVNDAGTNMRFLTAYLATKPGEWILTGSDRMKQRPISELVKCLQKLGAEIHYTENENFPPLLVKGQILKESEIEVDAGISSQFISALILVSPLLTGDLKILLKGKAVSKGYIYMTVELLRHFGMEVIEDADSIHIKPKNSKLIQHAHFEVESDWSSASYWYSICALSPDSKIALSSFHQKSWQADAILAKLFNQLGVGTTFHGDSILLENKHNKVEEFEFDFTDCPDIAQTLACTCFALKIPSKLYGLKTLQLKESKRIDALSAELKKLGAKVESTNDSLFIEPASKPQPIDDILIQTHKDHRMALSFAPLALKFPGLKIESPQVVNKSYPAFWDDLHSVGFSLNLQP